MLDGRYRGDGPRRGAFWGGAAAFAVLALILAAEAAGAHVQNAFAANTLTVNGLGLDGMPLGMWIVISSSGAMVKSGLTPLTFAGNHGVSYTVAVFDYGGWRLTTGTMGAQRGQGR